MMVNFMSTDEYRELVTLYGVGGADFIKGGRKFIDDLRAAKSKDGHGNSLDFTVRQRISR